MTEGDYPTCRVITKKTVVQRYFQNHTIMYVLLDFTNVNAIIFEHLSQFVFNEYTSNTIIHNCYDTVDRIEICCLKMALAKGQNLI